MRTELHRLSEGSMPMSFTGRGGDEIIAGDAGRIDIGQGDGSGIRSIHSRSTRSLEEVAERVDTITLETLNQFVKDHPPGTMTVVSIGPDGSQVM
ncbi:MAG: hypothetical protein HC898_10510 [Phycisphaerales bacterium]|nr:hypothetical protein [Phycisphaerales bacterium]